MNRLFFLLSGEHPSLPFSELKAIMEAEDYKYRVLDKWAQVLCVEADVKCIRSIASRSAMTRSCNIQLLKCIADPRKILRKARSIALDVFIERSESFAVRVQKVRKNAPDISSGDLERKLGKLILNKVKGTKVNLNKPQKKFFGILTGDTFLLGLSVAEISPKPFMERNPRRRPFFHPSSMSAKLARCAVNLAQPKDGDLVLDPFCGTASLLIEAGLIGCRVVGFDVKRHMAEGSLRNLLYYGLMPEGMAVADAKCLPITKADCIVTDPPYGRSSTTLGRNPKELVRDFLSTIGDKLPVGNRLCMISPKSTIKRKMGNSGLKRIESHLVYVHRSLTREVAVFERI